MFLSLLLVLSDSAEAKRERVAPSAGSGSVSSDEEREDELPTVVVLKKGDVGEDEYHQHRAVMKERSE